MTRRGLTIAERFWIKVDRSAGPDACWPWTLSTDKHGYGIFNLNARQKTGAHRAAFWLTHGRWPLPCCLHTCDNPPCCNPAHLYEGTQRRNMYDAIERQRSPILSKSGARNPRARLTQRQVDWARAQVAAGRTIRSVAKELNYKSPSAMSRIIRGLVWR